MNAVRAVDFDRGSIPGIVRALPAAPIAADRAGGLR